MLTMRGLPVLNMDVEDGYHETPFISDPVRGTVVHGAKILVKDNKIIAYGPAAAPSDLWFWKDKEAYDAA